MGKIKKIARRLLKKLTVTIYNILFCIIPTDRKLIVFDSSTATNYTGNPRSIYEEMLRLGLDRKYRLVWFLKDTVSIPIQGARVIRYGTPLYLLAMLRAGIWIFDARQPEFIKKRKNQYYIQTWHGTPLKKLALDMDRVNMAEGLSLDEYKKSFRKNTATWDYLVVQNDFSEKIFRSCFNFNKNFLRVGYPRNDILFLKNEKKEISRIKDELGLPTNKKIILYAPTWRDDSYDENKKYRFNSELDFNKLKKELEKDFVVIVKYHYLIENTKDWHGFENFVYEFGNKTDISLLYLVSDLLITDYSSVMFDYAILKRPIYFYTYDLENYRDRLRGFYFDLVEEAPGPISCTTDDLIEKILKNQAEDNEFHVKKEKFYKKFNQYDDGKASVKIIELVEELVKNG